MLSFKPGAWLTAALVMAAAGAGPAWARQGQSGPAPAAQQPAPQAQPPAGAPEAPAAQQPAQPDAGARKPRRASRRTPRASGRQPAAVSQDFLDEARAPRDPGPVRRELMLTASAMGGYDDNVTEGLGSGSFGRLVMASGSTADGEAALSYFVGNAARSLRADAAGTLMHYPKYLDKPAAGAFASLGATTRAGRRVTLRASERVGYEPFFSVYAPPGSGGALPSAGAGGVRAAELFERRSLNTNTTAGIDTRWTPRNSTSLSYSYGVRRYTGNTDYGDSRSHTADARYRLILSRAAAWNVDYRFQDLEYTYADALARPVRTHRIEAGPDIVKPFSRRTGLRVSLAAGAGRVESWARAETGTIASWAMTGRASASLAVSPTWSIDADYRRDFSMFQSVTDEVYTTDTARVSTGGLLGRRAALSLGTSYSNWKTPYAGRISGTFDVYGASAQLRVAVTRALAATAGYYYYRHRYSDPGALPEGFPAAFDRNAVRVGLSLAVPLAASSSQRPLSQR
ncbi:MAG TPA: hypothetical protein PLE61_02305 [Vicinamibacterales bacterium]|nr:hypothetical protein [Vicinamibacterales bacterium]